METKEIEVRCPCCESNLAIDVRTRKVLRWARPAELDELGKPVPNEANWDAALDRARGRERGAIDKFDQALSKEQSRAQDLDELFRKAEEKLRDEEE
jgi:hypothetical protein